MARDVKSQGGGRLQRSEVVTVRLDPKLNHLCELAARAQRRTKSSFIEWAIAHSLNSVQVPGTGGGFNEDPDVSISDLAERLWDVDEPDRLIALANYAPALLTHDEQLIWKLISTCGYFWRGKYKDSKWAWSVNPTDLVSERVREKWILLLSIVNGERSKNDLPSVLPPISGAGAFDSDLDEDVPF